MVVHLIEIEETIESDLGEFYGKNRISILKDCALIRSDIYRWRRRRFDTACAIYHTAQQKDVERETNALVHTLYPHFVTRSQDQRTLKERFTYAVTELTMETLI